jgi:HSP20 family protein
MTYRRLMWSEALELIERAERLHRQFFQCATSASGPAWEPPADIFETERDVVLLVALPGVPPEYVHVSIADGQLRISGTRPWPEELRRATIRRLEIPYGRFERRLELPDGEFELTRQELAHGCVAVYLRRI